MINSLPPENALYLMATSQTFSDEDNVKMQSYKALDKDYLNKLVNFQDYQNYSTIQWVVHKNNYQFIHCFIENFANEIKFDKALYQRGDPVSPWSLALSHNSQPLLDRFMHEKMPLHEKELYNTLYELVRSKEQYSIQAIDYFLQEKIVPEEKLKDTVVNALIYEKIDLFKHIISTNPQIINSIYALNSSSTSKSYFDSILDIVCTKSLKYNASIRKEAIEYVILNTDIPLKSIYRNIKSSSTEDDAKMIIKPLYDMILEKNKLSKTINLSESKKALKI